MKQTATHCYFWKSPLSNWHMANFTIEGITYVCTEQHMMAKKALMFNDFETYQLIMKSNSPREHQQLGRTVKNFIKPTWDLYAKEIVYNGNFARFSQNQDQLDLLMSTKGKLTEASPYDVIWGVGLGENDPLILDEKNWKGTNWLGEVLSLVRYNLEKQYQGRF